MPTHYRHRRKLHNKSIRAAYADSVEFYAEEGSLDQIETIKTRMHQCCLWGNATMHNAVAINYARSIAHLPG